MNTSKPSEPAGHVLPFRRQGSLTPRRPASPPPIEDLNKYERTPGEPDDYRHRMTMNAFAAAATIMLIVIGIWIADVMAALRKNQDCALTGRRNCAPIDVPKEPR